VSERASFLLLLHLSQREGQVFFSMVLLVAAGSSGICKAFFERNSGCRPKESKSFVCAVSIDKVCMCKRHGYGEMDLICFCFSVLVGLD
jgi:hypothetical protein